MQDNIDGYHSLTRMVWTRLKWCHQSHLHQHESNVASALCMLYNDASRVFKHKKLLLADHILSFSCCSTGILAK